MKTGGDQIKRRLAKRGFEADQSAHKGFFFFVTGFRSPVLLPKQHLTPVPVIRRQGDKNIAGAVGSQIIKIKLTFAFIGAALTTRDER